MKKLPTILLGLVVILYGVSLVLPNRTFDPNVLSNPKYSICNLATAPGAACAPSTNGVPSECWSPKNLYPDKAVMSARDIANYCGSDWNTPVGLVENGLNVNDIFGGGLMPIFIGILTLIAILFGLRKHHGIGLVIAGVASAFVFTFDNSKKLLDESGTHFLTGGHAAIGFYLLEASMALLLIYFIWQLVLSRGKSI